MVFNGIQTGVLPGPPFMPVGSQNIKSTIERAVSGVRLDTLARTILSTLNIEPDADNSRFFSSTNVDLLHEEILKKVQERTHKILQKQSQHDLVLIMRSAYMTNPGAGITALNQTVVDQAVEIIVVNLEMHEHAQSTVERSQSLMDYGVSTTVTGTKFYEREKK